jgi:hypothetical protein
VLLEILVASSVSIHSIGRTHNSRDYDHGVIDSNQFVNGLWMGTILLVLGLIPGLLDRMVQGLIDAGAATRFPFPRAMRIHFFADHAEPAPFRHRRWLTAAGMVLIVLTAFAYIVR